MINIKWFWNIVTAFIHKKSRYISCNDWKCKNIGSFLYSLCPPFWCCMICPPPPGPPGSAWPAPSSGQRSASEVPSPSLQSKINRNIKQDAQNSKALMWKRNRRNSNFFLSGNQNRIWIRFQHKMEYKSKKGKKRTSKMRGQLSWKQCCV